MITYLKLTVIELLNKLFDYTASSIEPERNGFSHWDKDMSIEDIEQDIKDHVMSMVDTSETDEEYATQHALEGKTPRIKGPVVKVRRITRNSITVEIRSHENDICHLAVGRVDLVSCRVNGLEDYLNPQEEETLMRTMQYIFR